MKKAFWVVNLPDDAKLLVKSGQVVSAEGVLAEKKEKKIKTPVQGKVVDVDSQKIKLEFKTKKISGQGLNQLRGWGELSFQVDITYSQLNSDYNKRVLVVKSENLTGALVSKARALGVSGLVVIGEKIDEKEWPIPVIAVDEETLQLIKKVKGVKCLLDAGNDCLLIPEGAKG